MSSIVDLPDEILIEIFSHFTYENSTLQQLALVCQRFHITARKLLLQHVELHDLSADVWNASPPQSNFDLFMRTINENPSLATLVRNLKLSWNRERSRNHIWANELLEKLTSLQSLSIIATRLKTDPIFTDHKSLQYLSSLHFEDELLNLSDITPYMFLASMRHISITYLQNPYMLEDYPPRSSPISSLEFGPDVFLPERVLEKILRWPRDLKKLDCHVPGFIFRRHPPYFKQMKNIFSPQSIQQALTPVAHSLVELNLKSDGTFWPAYDKTRLDLREFKALQIARIPSILFFDQAPVTYSEVLAKIQSHNQLYGYLPQSLVTLRIDYDHFSPIFFYGNQWFDVPQDAEDLWPAQLVWIAELARHKQDCFPNFQLLQVKEGESASQHFKTFPLTEELLSPIREDLKGSGIRVHLNIPKSDNTE
ncbi:hypothetical protein F5884DRAFT_760663 [Xylogone sp. PMI_703]|nr:hypothetical protein F5884DRAFT_760663 [Xylogone sp. PMI_703]